MAATYKVYVDWDNNGTFTAAADDVTARILDGRSPVTISYGRDTPRTGSPISPGEAAFTLDNQSRDYSPENTSSPLTGKVSPGRPVLIQAVSAGVTTTLYRGNLDDFELAPDRGDRSVSVRCLDALGRLRGVEVSTVLHTGIRTGDAVGVILDAMSWPDTLRDVDPGATLMPYWWLSQTDAYDALMDLVASEGVPALVTIASDGTFIYRDRHHRAIEAASLTSQATWRSSGIEPVMSGPTGYDHGWKEIVNSVTVDVPIRRAASEVTQVWSSDGQITVDDGETVTVIAQIGDALAQAITPVEGTDYTAVDGSVDVSLGRSTGQIIPIRITGVGAAAVIDALQLRGRTLDTVTTVQVTVEDAGSISAYGRRKPADGQQPVWAGIHDARAVGEILVGRRAERLPTITTTMAASANTTRLGQALTRDLSDRVHVTEAHTGLDADCFIERTTHNIGQGGTEHLVTFAVEKAPTETATPITFGVASRGFNDGKFQVLGITAPSGTLRFDIASQGFAQGVFAY